MVKGYTMNSLKYYFICLQDELRQDLASAIYSGMGAQEIRRLFDELETVTAKLETMED